ncbi:MAG: hypothetical protein WBB18_04980, partial [Nodosilinea sp.]
VLSIPDSLYGANYLWQIYTRARADYSRRVAVPILWDMQIQTIGNDGVAPDHSDAELGVQRFCRSSRSRLLPQGIAP